MGWQSPQVFPDAGSVLFSLSCSFNIHDCLYHRTAYIRRIFTHHGNATFKRIKSKPTGYYHKASRRMRARKRECLCRHRVVIVKNVPSYKLILQKPADSKITGSHSKRALDREGIIGAAHHFRRYECGYVYFNRFLTLDADRKGCTKFLFKCHVAAEHK